MRVVGQQRAAPGAARGRRRPRVRRTGKAALRHRRQEGVPGLWHGQSRPQPRRQRGVFRQRGDAVPGNVGQDVGQPRLVFERHRDARAQHFLGQVARQLQCHQLDDRDGIRRLPRGDGGVEDEELGRASAEAVGVDLGQAGVHAGGIGAQRLGRLGRLRLDRLARQAVEVETAQQGVRLDRAAAEQFRQPALRGAAQRHHLPQPVLRMGVAQPEIGIGVAFGEDVRHGRVVAHDLDLGLGTLDGDDLVVVGQRAGGEVVDQPRADHGQHQGRAHQA